MNFKEIEKILIEIFGSRDIIIDSMRLKKEYNMDLLEIILDADLNSDELAEIHQMLLDQLTDDIFDENYGIEMATVGIERELKTKEQVLNELGGYLYLESPKYRGYMTLLSIKEDNDDIMTFQYNEKGRIRKMDINYNDISFIRIAIKF